MNVTIREHDPNDDLSDRDIAFINRSEGSCPMCFAGDLIGGPRGGASQNFRCDGCQSEFNLHLMDGDREKFVFGGHHLPISDGKIYQLSALRSRWGELDNSPPPGVSAEQWAALEAEAAQALDNLCDKPGEAAGGDHS